MTVAKGERAERRADDARVQVEESGTRRPFMRGIMVHSLMSRGVEFEKALAGHVEWRLKNKDPWHWNVYVQVDGESFSRREVVVRHRQGNELLVEGVLPGERVVTLGGAAIRRASLMASGETQGHVH